MNRACLKISILIMTLLAVGLGGCGNTSSPVATNAPAGGNVVASSYPVNISGDVPRRATKLRVSGDNKEGETVLTVTMDAAPSVTVDVSPDVQTLLLEYLDASGNLVAQYSESSLNQHDVDFRRGINAPPLATFAPSVNAQSTTAPDVFPTVTGSDVKFSFAFFGCNRAKVAGEDPRFDGQISPEERASTANVAQLRQHFEDIDSLNPKPRYIFLCGDAVTKGKASGATNEEGTGPVDDALRTMTAVVEKEMKNWSLIRRNGAVIIDQDGNQESVQPGEPGSLFSREGIKVVVMPGNHEMCFKVDNDKNGPPPTAGYDYEYPNEYAGEAFVNQMQSYILGNNGPTVGTTYDPENPLQLFDDRPVARDESQLSYTFRDGENLFMVLNTDTYVGRSKWNGSSGDFRIRRIPLRWVREQVRQAQSDATIRHIFVFGHRPIQTINGEAGIDDRQALTFFKLLNNPLANTPLELDTPLPDTPHTKVRGYFCAHAHLLSTRQPPGGRDVQQIVAGSAGSEPDPAPADEGATGATPGKPFPWFGFAVVAVRDFSAGEEVDLAWFGRNVHPSKHTPNGVWWEQEPLKLRRENIQGPDAAPAKTPKAIRRLYKDPDLD